jgi:outer membrane protein TolC
MRPRHWGRLAALATLAALSGARAAEGINLADGISAGEAVRLVLERDQTLAALEKARQTAGLKARAATALPDPELRTSRFDFQNDSGGMWSQNYNLALRWSPPRPGERELAGRAALGRASEVDGAISMARQKLAADVRLLHMDLVFLERQIQLAESLADVRLSASGFVAEQARAGLKTLLDRSEAELALAEARAQVEDLRLERRVKRRRFAVEIGLAPAAAFTLQTEGDPLSYALDVPAAGAAPAFNGRAELAVLSAKCSEAEAVLKLGETARYPWFSFLQVSRDLGGPRAPNAWGFRFGVDLPVFRWKREDLLAPRAGLEQCRAETAAERNRISAEVDDALERLRASADRLAFQAKTVDSLLPKAVEAAEAAVAAGESDMLPRYAAEARRLTREQARLTQLRDYRRLEIELALAMGRTAP